MAAAVLRGVLSFAVVPLAPFLYREHAAVLVLLRPTKEVLLFAGFMIRRGDLSLLPVVLSALPILLGGVWVFFALGRSFRDELEEAELPGVAGRLLPRSRLDHLQETVDERGMWVVFLGRLAAFPSSLVAAAAGSSGVSWREFLRADAGGALLSLALAVALGYGLGGAYESGGPWLTALGVAVLVALAVLLGRALTSRRRRPRQSSD